MRRSSDSGQHTTGNVTQVHPLYTSEMKQANVFEWFDLCTSEIDDLDREGKALIKQEVVAGAEEKWAIINTTPSKIGDA